MHIKAKDLVLEIGPGGYPFWRSDCLLDKWDHSIDTDVNTRQFGGVAQVTKGKPLFITKDGRIPFKDKSFDYLICSHVLEHVPCEDLPLLVSEINRVSKRSFIEIPTFLFDYMYDFEVHTNLMDIVDGRIVCIDKKNTSLPAVKHFTTTILKHRDAGRFAVEKLDRRLFASGKEFHDDISIDIVSDEDEFFELVKGKHEITKAPSFFWLVQNRIKRHYSELLKPKKQKSFFDPLLL